MFALHPRLEQDTELVTLLPLCQLRLMKDARFPWLILIPARADISEFHELEPAERIQLTEEITQVSETLEALCKPDKINVGALGNLVPQLHIHVVARRRQDPAWPGPVWGHGTARPYEPDALDHMIASLREMIAGL